jgi:hypothetical protein
MQQKNRNDRRKTRFIEGHAMTSRKIDPQDKSLKTLFQDFYRVPDYQREFVWGETNPKGKAERKSISS